ncbi:SAM-dependent methyltransferase [Paenibacillus periandrae]|uniref:SAM-dependent methyltransferase n=1 Tax=Paenibacillus periandrae TaxID=1761741 RepID=UPI001F09B4E8|nr:SAM-dependent methyltransferase [Paenibacillus periandrae]
MNHNEPSTYRFSEAPIWELQRAYYEEQGIRAWQSEEVPQYITSNPMIATAYAEIIFGFLQDRARLGHITEPVMIVELGAGSGRLACQVLKELCELKDYAGLPLPPFRYVMTDLAIRNISYWQQHESLVPYVEQGILDFAQFDAVTGTELHLTQSGERIGPAEVEQPLLIIANYFFDSIPQELLYVDEGRIFECDVSLHVADEATKRSPSDVLETIIPEYHYRRAAEYEQESYPYRSLIELYTDKLEDSHVLLPVVGLICLERLGQLSQAGFCLLTADKGDHRLESWEFAEPPKLIHHGSFSLEANYHAIQYVCEHKGALTLFTTHQYNNLNVGCILMLQEPVIYAHTRLAYRRFVDRFGPDDFFSLKAWFEEQPSVMELPQLHAFWRLSGYDAQLFLHSAERIEELLPVCSEHAMKDICHGLHTMWKSHYPMEEKPDLALACGRLLVQMDLFEDALLFFERSRYVDDADSHILYTMALCYYEVGKEAAARNYAHRAVALDPDHEGASALLDLL